MGDPLWCLSSYPLPDRSAQRQAAESKLRNSQRISERKSVLTQHLNGIFACRCVRGSVTSGVISQNLKVRKQVVHLKIPHGLVGADRVRQDQDGPPGTPLQAIEHPRVVNGGEGQIIAPCRCLLRLLLWTRLPELREKPQRTLDTVQAFPVVQAQRGRDGPSLQECPPARQPDSGPH